MEHLDRSVDLVLVDPPVGQHDDLGIGQLSGQQLFVAGVRRRLLGQGLLVDHPVERLDLLGSLVDPIVEPPHLGVERVDEGPVEEGRTEHQPDPEGEEHRRQADDVGAQLDHEKLQRATRLSSLPGAGTADNSAMLVRLSHAVLMIRRIGAEIITTAPRANAAASTIKIRSRV